MLIWGAAICMIWMGSPCVLHADGQQAAGELQEHKEKQMLPENSTGESVSVSPRKGSSAGGLNISHTQLPGNTLAYLSCEGVVFGDPAESTPLFEVKVSDVPNVPGAHWTVKGNSFSYTWTYKNGIRVAFDARPEACAVRLHYKVTNASGEFLKRVMLHTCIPTTEAPVFFSELEKSPVHAEGKAGNHMGFYDRTYLWSKGRPFGIGRTAKGGQEIHLSFSREGQPPVEWGWWKNGPETFDIPFIAVQSGDGTFTAALGFDAADWASCNGGDERACFHLFPLFGDLKPGESGEVNGRFYLMRGEPEDVLEQFKHDFPKWNEEGRVRPRGK